MEYNSHAKDSLVDQARSEGKEILTTTIKIWDVQRTQTKPGRYIVTLVSDDKRRFSAFEGIWEMQQLPVQDLTEGDELEVTYVQQGDYCNYLRVVRAKANDGLPF